MAQMGKEHSTPLEWQTPGGNTVQGVFDALNQTLRDVTFINGNSGVIYHAEKVPDAKVIPEVVLRLEDALRAQAVQQNALDEAQELARTIASYSRFGSNPGVEPYKQRHASYEHLVQDMDLLAQTRTGQALYAVDKIVASQEPSWTDIDNGLRNLAQQVRTHHQNRNQGGGGPTMA